MSVDSLRVGVLIEDKVRKWVEVVLDTVCEETDAEITLVVFNDGFEMDTSDHTNEIMEDGLWRLLRKISWKYPSLSAAMMKPIQASSIEPLARARQIRCSPTPTDDGSGHQLPDGIVDELANETDVILRYGFGILKGDVLNAPRFGVLSGHAGDIRKYRGAPPGFWEWMQGESEVGVTLQRINETLDGGEIIAFESVDISDLRTWQDIVDRLYSTHPKLTVEGLQNIRDPMFEPTKPSELGPVYRAPVGIDMLRYLGRNSYGRLYNALTLA